MKVYVINFYKCIGIFAFLFFLSNNINAQITSYPYIEDFESGLSGWSIQSINNSSWEYGTPSGIIINSAASGNNALVTNLSGNYNNEEESYLLSPIFDLSALTDPIVKFNLWWNCEYNFDGVVLQSSIDSQTSWQNVGAVGTGINWYNMDNIVSLPEGSQEGWSGRISEDNGSIGWETVEHPLNQLVDESNVVFRLVFSSDYSVVDEGVGFDNFKIYGDDCFAGEDIITNICSASYQTIFLNDYLTISPNLSGYWESLDGIEIVPDNEAVFNGVGIGNYKFRYTIPVTPNCPGDSAEITIVITSLSAGIGPVNYETCTGVYTEEDLFNAIAEASTPNPGGIWSPEITIGSNRYMYTHPASGNCPESSVEVIVTESFTIVIEPEPRLIENTCYLYETINLNDFLLVEAPSGGKWESRGKEIVINDEDEVDFPDATPEEVEEYIFYYTYGSDCNIYKEEIKFRISVDPIPYAGTSKTVIENCYNFNFINLNKYLDADADTGGTWAPFHNVTIDGDDNIIFPDTGEDEYLYSFTYTVENACLQFDEIIIDVQLYTPDSLETIPIPDSEFERYLIESGIDSNPIPNSEILVSDLCGITTLYISGYDISNFSGLEYFKNLIQFNSVNNQAFSINEIDFSNNLELNEIFFSSTQNLVGINVNQNEQLTDVTIAGSNLFNNIDVQHNTYLERLYLINNNILSINLEYNINLEYLSIASNPIAEIDLSNLSQLKYIETSQSSVVTLDFSNNPLMTTLFCDSTELLTNVNLNNNTNTLLSTVDFQNCPSLNCILVDDVTYAETAINWDKDVPATYIDNVAGPIIITGAQNLTIQYDGEGFFQGEIDTWIAQNGNALVSTDNCGEINWVHILDGYDAYVGGIIVTTNTFYAYDIFGNEVSTTATLTIENIPSAGLDNGSVEILCDIETYDLIGLMSVSIYDSNYDNSVVSFVQTGGPPGALFEVGEVNFPNTGAGQYTYVFEMSVFTNINIGEFEINRESDAVFYVNDVTVSFNPGSDGYIEWCGNEPLTLDDLFNSLGGVPDVPEGDASNYWTPSVFQGVGNYVYNPSADFPECGFDTATVSVGVALPPPPFYIEFTDENLYNCGDTITYDLNSFLNEYNLGGDWYDSNDNIIPNGVVDIIDTEIGSSIASFIYRQDNYDCGFINESPLDISFNVSALSVGVDAEIGICYGYLVKEVDLLTSLGADFGGFWTPSINPVNVGSGIYTYSHGDCSLGVTSEIIVLPYEPINQVGDADNAIELICPGEELSESTLRSALTEFDAATPGGEWTDENDDLVIFPVTEEGLYTYTHAATDCFPETSNSVTVSNAICDLRIKTYLQGASLTPNSGEETLMRDDLRVGGYLPAISPYIDGLSCNASVFTPTGSDTIVDWVWVELRDPNDNTSIIASKSALLQRDGDIVDVDGLSSLSFNIASGNYYVVVNHRNHLGIMTETSLLLNGSTTIVDFTDGSINTFGSNAQTSFGKPLNVLAMWAGDVNDNGQVRYLGPGNDTNMLKDTVLGDVGNNTNSNFYPFMGYDNADINMNGQIRYLGPGNDSNILKDIILSHPSNGSFSNFFPFATQIQN